MLLWNMRIGMFLAPIVLKSQAALSSVRLSCKRPLNGLQEVYVNPGCFKCILSFNLSLEENSDLPKNGQKRFLHIFEKFCR